MKDPKSPATRAGSVSPSQLSLAVIREVSDLFFSIMALLQAGAAGEILRGSSTLP
ncbi:MAG TPA: hypothetical protein VJ044_03635 [Candidatus Hodarchaeales archaeon]|nr:hypothetical protein [Candidatus Hodarchaeales archaeon]